jgi:hypothetical protein
MPVPQLSARMIPSKRETGFKFVAYSGEALLG